MTGYALRVERINATGKGVQLAFVKYEGWDNIEYIGDDKILTSAFNPTCTIKISVKGTTLSAELSTTRTQSSGQAEENLIHNPTLETEISANGYGGFGVYFTGTALSGGRVMFNQLDVTWAESGADLEEPTAVDLPASPAGDGNNDNKDPDDGKTDDKNPGDGNNDNKNPDDGKTDDKNINDGKTDDNKTDDKNTDDKTQSGDNKKPAVTVPKTGTIFIINGVKYKITKKASKGTGTVSVCGVKKKTVKSVKIADTVSYKGAKYKITEIAKKAFANCKKLKKITITGKNLTKVGKNAFKGIHKKCVIKVSSSKLKKYKKLLKNKGQAKTVKITK